MQVTIRIQKYSQKELDAAIDAALADQSAREGYDSKLVKESKITGGELKVAWQKYCNLFGGPPKGTQKQLASLLELIPARRIKSTNLY